MKEGISYSFLLNIIILFIFVCFSVVMGISSYYRAYKAGAIIVESIEKYEGYNCLSEKEIALKLGSITYNVPFNVSCDSKGTSCKTGDGYVVVVNDLDLNSDKKAWNENMNSSYSCEERSNVFEGSTTEIKVCSTNKHYQYTVYTYMYFDLPVINSIVRIPFISKSKILYEFRNFYDFNGTFADTFLLPESFVREVEFKDLRKWITPDKYNEYTIGDLNDIYNSIFNGISGANSKLTVDDVLLYMSGTFSESKYDMRDLSALKDAYYFKNNKNFNAFYLKRDCGYERNY